MKTFWKKLRSLLPSKRKWMQLYAALLFNANFKGFSQGLIHTGESKRICVPGLNCYSCPGAVGACPLGSLQGAFSADKSTLFYVGGILLLYCVLAGRMICGWLCPFGLIQELLHKIKTPKLKKNKVTRVLSYFKYVVLVFFVVVVPLLYAFRDTPLPAFCKYICPAGTLEGGIGLLANKVNESSFSMLGPLFTWKFLLLVSFLVGCVFVFRLFCRFVCPLGALYGLFNKISVFGIKVEPSKCTHCGVCANRCQMDVKIAGDMECISCGECVDSCPTKAIVWKGVRKKTSLPEADPQTHKKAKYITRGISCVLLLALLASTVIYAWPSQDTPGSEISQESFDDEVSRPPLGNQADNTCYGAELPVVTGDGIQAQTVNPASIGKITLINFWGTWCGPCVQELPYFDRIATEYRDKVAVIAVHSYMAADTAPEFVKTYYPDSPIQFACDLENAAYYSLLGGRGSYPYTLVLDENGVIAKVYVGSLTYEELKEDVEALLGE